MAKLIGLGIGAGLVSALLFGLVATGAPAGMLLSYAAPLPILIVALGWHSLLGLLAAATGAFALSIGLRSSAGVAFALGPAFPAWALAYLTLLRLASYGRAEPLQSPDPQVHREPHAGWLAPSHVLLCIGLAGAFIALCAAIGLGGGSYEQFQDTLRRVAETLLRFELDGAPRGGRPRVPGVASSGLITTLTTIAPAVAAAVFGLTLAINLWVAGKVVAVSGRLPRPWFPMTELRMGTIALAGFAAAFLLAFGPGFVGVGGRALAGGIAMMFALQGLALLHLATRGRPGRTAILTLVYILAIFFGGTILPLLAVAGMVDSATPIRRRFTNPPDGRPLRGG